MHGLAGSFGSRNPSALRTKHGTVSLRAILFSHVLQTPWCNGPGTGIVLKEVFTAYSRQPGQPKVYVQDILQNELETKVCNILHKEEGHLYVCGDVRMARDVAQTLKRMLVKKLNHTEQQAEEYFFQLKSQKRYHEDIFGAVFPHEVKRI